VPEELPTLFRLVQSGRLRPEKYISHRLPLSEGAKAYQLFDARDGGAIKLVLTPYYAIPPQSGIYSNPI
jgi:threonine dehydrogenase-like Zn-dependent dehydrogenase